VHMGSAITRVNAAFEHRLTGILPKGELWFGTELLKRAGLEDNTEGHLALVRCLKQDITCFPISHEPRVNKALGYRYFPVGALQKASEMGDRFLAALIDGPLQTIWPVMRLPFLIPAIYRIFLPPSMGERSLRSARRMPMPCSIPVAKLRDSYLNSFPAALTAWQAFNIESTILSP
jgi:hypothetical protein